MWPCPGCPSWAACRALVCLAGVLPYQSPSHPFAGLAAPTARPGQSVSRHRSLASRYPASVLFRARHSSRSSVIALFSDSSSATRVASMPTTSDAVDRAVLVPLFLPWNHDPPAAATITTVVRIAPRSMILLDYISHSPHLEGYVATPPRLIVSRRSHLNKLYGHDDNLTAHSVVQVLEKKRTA